MAGWRASPDFNDLVPFESYCYSWSWRCTMTDRIEINPSIMLGKPVIRGTRIPVEILLRKLAEGAQMEDLLDAYPR